VNFLSQYTFDPANGRPRDDRQSLRSGSDESDGPLSGWFPANNVGSPIPVTTAARLSPPLCCWPRLRNIAGQPCDGTRSALGRYFPAVWLAPQPLQCGEGEGPKCAALAFLGDHRAASRAHERRVRPRVRGLTTVEKCVPPDLELRAIVDDEDPSCSPWPGSPDAMTTMQLDAIWFASSCIMSAPA
jgi:hypothetical protein